MDPIVTELKLAPGQETGCSCPTVWASENDLLLAYYARNPKFPGWSSGAPPDHPGLRENTAVLRFTNVTCSRFGYPNSEALSGHDLYKFGLRHYTLYEVGNSPWIAELTRGNEVHPRHTPNHFSEARHFVMTFEDSTLEVVAQTVALEALVEDQSVEDALRKILGGSSA